MDILNALLAFSVSMLVFSTMALVVVEVLHRFNHTREKYFAEMMEVFFEEMIWNKVSNVNVSDADLIRVKKEFMRVMTSVSGLVNLDIELANDDDDDDWRLHSKPAAKPLTKDTPNEKEKKRKSALSKVTTRNTVGVIPPKTTERLTTVEFTQRLARTEVGKLLLAQGKEKAKAMVIDIASQLNAISSGATSDFKQRSRKLALVASFFIAFGLNIDAIHLFKQYTQDQSLSSKVVDHAPDAIAAYEQQQQRLEELEQSLKDSSEDAKEAVATLKDSFENARQSIESSALSLTELGVPIGFNYYPWCRPIAQSAQQNKAAVKQSNLYLDSRCNSVSDAPGTSKWKQRWIAFISFVGWLCGVLLATILIGQGSPFWFQLFQKLSMALQLLKGLSLVKGKQEGGLTNEPEKDDYSPDKAVDIYFQTLAAQPDIHLEEDSSSIASPPKNRLTRPILATDGRLE